MTSGVKHSIVSKRVNVADYELSRAAREDLLGIFFTGLETFGLFQAEKYRVSLNAAFDLLAEYPRAARIREELSGSVRALPHKAHIIIYEIRDADRVVILRIRHSREDWTADLV